MRFNKNAYFLRFSFDVNIWVILLLCFPLKIFSNNYHIKNLDKEQNLPQPYVYTLTQDNLGYLWIGTGDGLTRYDGYTYKTFTVKDSLANNFLTCSFKTEKGIWFGHINGDLTYYSNNKFTKKVIAFEDKTMITDIEESPDESILVSTYSNGLLLIDSDHRIKMLSIDKNNTPSISSFKVVDSNEILIGSENGLSIYHYDNSFQLQFKGKVTGVPEIIVKDIVKLPGQPVYIVATQNEGIYKLTKNKYEYKAVKILGKLNRNISGVQSLFIDRGSNLWISTFGEGLYKFLPNEYLEYHNFIHFTKEDGLATENIKMVFEDREGIIWVSNYGAGLGKILKKHYSYLFYDKELIGDNIYSMTVDEKYYWLGTDNGLLKINRYSSKQKILYNEEHSLPTDNITAVFNTGKYIWVGTGENGIYRFDIINESAQSFHIHNGNLENSITSITGDETQLWIGTRKGVCNINLINDSIYWYTINKGGLPNNNVNYIYFDSNNRPWIATVCNTLSVIEEGEVRKIPIPLQNNFFVLKTITEDRDGNIWIGTLGNGLFKLETEKLIHYTTSEGLFSDYCYSILSDTQENLWVGHQGGISKINTSNLYIKAIQQKFEINKLYEFKSNAVVFDKDSSVYLGFNKGVLKINMHDKITASIPPLLNIINVKVNDKDIEIEERINLASGRYKLSIDYIGISLKEPELTKYEYILEGYDSDPIITKGTHIVYSGLSTGNYVFRILAMNSDGLISENKVYLEINIKPPFWEKAWFYLVFVAAVFAIITLLMYRQKRIVVQENLKLEEKVKARTAEILMQKEQIEKQNELIGAKNKNITDSIIYASKIENALIPSPEEVSLLLTNSFVFNKPRDIVSGDFYWIADKNNTLILAVADSTGHGVPGAFMSILGMTLLNSIVLENNITSPEEILSIMRKKIIRLLRQEVGGKTSIDGINMAICCFDKSMMKLKYAGAYHPLVHVRNGELNLIKSVKESLGISYKTRPYISHEFTLKKGDCLYMFSDGFQDQFGGIKNKRFTSTRLYQMLIDISVLPISEQKQIVSSTFEDWIEEYNQTDDVLVVGVQI